MVTWLLQQGANPMLFDSIHSRVGIFAWRFTWPCRGPEAPTSGSHVVLHQGQPGVTACTGSQSLRRQRLALTRNLSAS